MLRGQRVALGPEPRDLVADVDLRVRRPTKRSSSIFASSSAIGCSKSRNFRSMGTHGYTRRGHRKAKRKPRRGRPARDPGRVHDLDAVRPTSARAARASSRTAARTTPRRSPPAPRASLRRVADRHRASPPRPAAALPHARQQLGAERPARVGRGQRSSDPARVLLHEPGRRRGSSLCGQSPAVQNSSKRSVPLHDQDRVLRDQARKLLVALPRRTSTSSARCHRPARSWSARRACGSRAPGRRRSRCVPAAPAALVFDLTGRALADVRDAAADERLSSRPVLGERVAGQVEPERLALAREPPASLQSGSLARRRRTSPAAAARLGAPNRSSWPAAWRARPPARPPASRPAAGASASARFAPEGVESAGSDQRLEHAAVDRVLVAAGGRGPAGRGSGPPAARSATMCSTAACPTPLIAPRP